MPIPISEERYKTAMIVIFVLTLFVQILDGTVVNVAIPTLADAFGVTDTEIDRAIIGYVERAKASTAVISVAVIAPAIGPVLGGFLIETLNWRWIFYVNIPLGVVAFAAGWFIIRDFRAESVGRFDIPGFVLAGLGLGATLFGVTMARDQGWRSPVVLASLAVGISSMIALPLVERRRTSPLLRFELFRAPIFRSIQIVAFPTYAAFVGLIFLIPVYLQSLRGFSALETGLSTFPQAIGVWISSQIVGRLLYRRVGPRRLLFTGLTAALVVGLFVTRLDLESSLWTVRSLMFARGFGLGIAFIAIQTAIYAQTSLADTAQATALFSANRQSAPAFGVALSAAVLAASATDVASPALADYRLAFLVSALLFVPAIVATWWVRDEDAAATLAR